MIFILNNGGSIQLIERDIQAWVLLWLNPLLYFLLLFLLSLHELFLWDKLFLDGSILFNLGLMLFKGWIFFFFLMDCSEPGRLRLHWFCFLLVAFIFCHSVLGLYSWWIIEWWFFSRRLMLGRLVFVVGLDVVDVNTNFLIALTDINESIFEVVVNGLIFWEKLVQPWYWVTVSHKIILIDV